MTAKTKATKRTPDERAAAKLAMKEVNAAKKSQVAAMKAEIAAAKAAAKAASMSASQTLQNGAPVAPAASPVAETAWDRANEVPGAAPTTTLATELQTAFDHFNKTIFGGALPHVMLRVERLKKYKGYFKGGCWGATVTDSNVSEIVMDPILFRERKLAETLSTLVHEMVHLQDHVNGTAPKKAYHGKSWVAIMNTVGLTPVIMDAKGNKTGKATGVNSTHKIVIGAPFDVSCKALLATGYQITWSAAPEAPKPEKGKKKRAGGKFKYAADCGTAFWAKPGLVAECRCGCESAFKQLDKEDGETDDADA